MPSTRRLVVYVILLGLALVALRHRSRVQAWAYGAQTGVHALEGRPAPELPATTHALDGTPLSLASLRGRVILLHFWTFGCSNCKHMLPRYSDWHARFASRGLSVVGVHTPEMDYERDVAALGRFVRDQDIRWPVVVDADEAIWSRYRVSAWPTMVLIDKSGVVRATFVGDDQADAVEAELRKRLGP
jgi:thiol-disulfide isomerase/thioredoxin